MMHAGWNDSLSASLYTTYLRLSGHHLGFITSGYLQQHWQLGKYVQRFEPPRNYMVAIRMLTIRSLQAYTMYFRLSGRHLGCVTSGYFEQRWHLGRYVQRVEPPRNYMGYMGCH